VLRLSGGAAQARVPDCRTAGLVYGAGGSVVSDAPGRNIESKLLITHDGTSAIVQVHIGGTFHLYSVALGGPESWTPVVEGERTCTPLGLRGGNLLFSAGTMQHPSELFITSSEGEGEQQLTHLNQAFLAGIRIPEVEHLLFPGADGVQVEGWIIKPPVGKPPYPTVLHIHGGPHASYGHTYYFEYQMLAGAGYAILFINHRGSTGYGDAFANRIIGDWGNLDYLDLMAGVDHAIEMGVADPDRLGCTGLSGGGYLTCWIVGQTDRFKAAVPENPVTNWHSFYGVSDIGPWFSAAMLGGHPHEIPEVYARCSPITYAHQCTTPTLVIQHERDYRCPPEQSEQFYTALRASGCQVEMLRIPDSPHVGHADGPPLVRRAQNEALLDWMNRYVGGLEAGE
jgi:dipeptidyl aminopeptidase/acylaminoacyl peptidase